MQKRGRAHQTFIRNHALKLLLLLSRLTRSSQARHRLDTSCQVNTINCDFDNRDFLILKLKMQLLLLAEVLPNERLVVRNHDGTTAIAVLEKKRDGSVTLWHHPLPLP
jgi:hypothetical protein